MDTFKKKAPQKKNNSKNMRGQPKKKSQKKPIRFAPRLHIRSKHQNMDNHQDNKSSNVDEVEDEVTMVDVLEVQTELEEDANAVLGPSDDKNCSYKEVFAHSCYFCSFIVY